MNYVYDIAGRIVRARRDILDALDDMHRIGYGSTVRVGDRTTLLATCTEYRPVEDRRAGSPRDISTMLFGRKA